jgi:hypothetical protein
MKMRVRSRAAVTFQNKIGTSVTVYRVQYCDFLGSDLSMIQHEKIGEQRPTLADK